VANHRGRRFANCTFTKEEAQSDNEKNKMDNEEEDDDDDE